MYAGSRLEPLIIQEGTAWNEPLQPAMARASIMTGTGRCGRGTGPAVAEDLLAARPQGLLQSRRMGFYGLRGIIGEMPFGPGAPRGPGDVGEPGERPGDDELFEAVRRCVGPRAHKPSTGRTSPVAACDRLQYVCAPGGLAAPQGRPDPAVVRHAQDRSATGARNPKSNAK